MSQETTDNFWQTWNSFQWPNPKPIFFRLYHDDDGNPLCYSMEDLAGSYIEVTAEEYAIADYNIKIQDGKIIKIRPKLKIKKLMIGDVGTTCHPLDVSVVVSSGDHVKWKIETHEQD